MVFKEVTANYKKPFNLFYYNRPKQTALKDRKGPVNYRTEPKIPVRSTNATRMRDKVIKEYMQPPIDAFEELRQRLMESGKLVLQEPDVLPRDNKTSHYRYKWARDIPVVSCRFTEHVMMYKKPPFTYEQRLDQCCGQYRLRSMEIKDPHIAEVQPEEEPTDLVPSILL